MHFEYKIKEVKPNIFAVIIKDRYDRAMTFCRVQEFYESPNPKFRGTNFSIWDYMKWYNEEYGNGFSYASDWSGFNVPLKTAWKCFTMLIEHQTPYDIIMDNIVSEIECLTFSKNGKRNLKAYIIGTDTTDGWLFSHEVCHGLWSTNKEYKRQAKSLAKEIDSDHYQLFKRNLLYMGYTDKVIDDEIQAYLMYGHDSEDFGKDVPMKVRKDYNKRFRKVLKVFVD